MFGQTSRVSSAHQHEEKTFMSVNVYKHLVLDVQPPRPPDLNYLVFYLWDT